MSHQCLLKDKVHCNQGQVQIFLFKRFLVSVQDIESVHFEKGKQFLKWVINEEFEQEKEL